MILLIPRVKLQHELATDMDPPGEVLVIARRQRRKCHDSEAGTSGSAFSLAASRLAISFK
jgi:hypothetical protein